jgi:hypothetical protein
VTNTRLVHSAECTFAILSAAGTASRSGKSDARELARFRSDLLQRFRELFHRIFRAYSDSGIPVSPFSRSYMSSSEFSVVGVA